MHVLNSPLLKIVAYMYNAGFCTYSVNLFFIRNLVNIIPILLHVLTPKESEDHAISCQAINYHTT